MFTDDDEDEAGEQSSGASGPSDELASIVMAADGESVTADRLSGSAKYYPDCRPYLNGDFEPQHMILLTTSAWAFLARGNGGVSTKLEASDGGVAICGTDELLVIVDQSICSIPYSGITGVFSKISRVGVHTAGKDYVLDVAKSADRREVFDAVEYLREAVRTSA